MDNASEIDAREVTKSAMLPSVKFEKLVMFAIYSQKSSLLWCGR